MSKQTVYDTNPQFLESKLKFEKRLADHEVEESLMIVRFVSMDQRMNSRVPVKLPVTCSFIDNRYRSMLSLGEVCDLSLGGIKVRVPIKPYSLRSFIVDYSMILPQPFSEIHGSGQIVWDRWETEKGCMLMGLKFLTLDQSQRMELENIVEEVHDGSLNSASVCYASQITGKKYAKKAPIAIATP